jgi:hypothetical protein
MHLLQSGFVQLMSDTGQVDGLSPCHAAMARCTRQNATQPALQIIGNDTALRREHFKGQSLQGIAGQQGLRLAELHMHGGFATPQHVVVHARHVVVHQGISMDQLNGTSRAHGGLVQGGIGDASSHSLAGGQHQKGAQTFATIEHGITHGLTEPRRGIGGNPLLQCRFNLLQLTRHPGLESGCRGQFPSSQGFMTPSSKTWICCSIASNLPRQNSSKAAER